MADVLQFVIAGKDQFSGTFGKLNQQLPSIKTLALASAAGIASMGAALVTATKFTADAQAEIGLFASRIGITTEALSKYQAVAQFAGVEAETLNDGFKELANRVAEAKTGIGAGAEALAALGIGIDEISNRSPDKQFEIFAEALDKVADSGEKVFLAEELMGDAGSQLLQTLSDGSQGLAEMANEAERFGVVVSSTAAANAIEFAQSTDRIDMAFTGLRNTIGEKFIPVMTELNNRFADFIADNRGAILDFGEKAITAFGWIAEKGAFAVGILVDSFRGLKMGILLLEIVLLEMTQLMLESFSSMANAALEFAEKLNFGGVLDGMISKLSDTKTAFDDTFINGVSQASDIAREQLQGIIDEGSMTGKVSGMVETIKAGYAEIVAAAQEAAPEVQAGYVPDEETTAAALAANMELIAANREALVEMHDAYFLTDIEKQQEWYAQQQELFAGHNDELALAEELHLAKMQGLEDTAAATAKAAKDKVDAQKIADDKKVRETMYTNMSNITNAVALFSSNSAQKLAKGIQRIRIGEALIDTYKGATAAYANAGGFPFGVVPAAISVAAGLANVAAIKGVSVAHGGLTEVPREQTFLLDKGERVIKTKQNEDLTEFLAQAKGGTSGGTQNINLTLFPNATNFDSLLAMSEATWFEVVEDKILPALTRLDRAGVTI